MVTKNPKKAPVTSREAPRLRDRLATRERVLDAVGRLLAREGFASLGVNAVAREAGVDKVLIYRYFGGLEALLEAWGRTNNFGAGSLDDAGAGRAGGTVEEKAAAFLAKYVRDLRASPEALEVMRWELVEDNPLTRRLACWNTSSVTVVCVPPVTIRSSAKVKFRSTEPEAVWTFTGPSMMVP